MRVYRTVKRAHTWRTGEATPGARQVVWRGMAILVFFMGFVSLVSCRHGGARSSSQQVVGESNMSTHEARVYSKQKRALSEIQAVEQERAALITARRAGIDAHASTTRSCREWSVLPFEDARQAWLTAWCAFRLQRWEEVIEASPRALRYFQLAGEYRRVVELLLLNAQAHAMLQQEEAREEALRLAQQWLLESREPLVGALDDRHAGDLTYLLAMHAHQGAVLRPFGVEHTPSTALFTELSRFDYASTSSFSSLAALWRLEAQIARDEGRLDASARALARAIWSDMAQGSAPGLMQDLELFALQADVVGEREVASRVLDLVVEFRMSQGNEASSLASSPLLHRRRTPAQLARLVRVPSQRRALLRLLRARHHKHISEDEAMSFELFLRDFKEIEAPEAILATGDFALTSEVGLALAERGYRPAARRYLELAMGQLEAVRRTLPSITVRQSFLRTWRHVYMALLHQRVGIDTDRLPHSDYARALEIIGAIKARGLRDLLEGWSYLATSGVLEHDKEERLERALPTPLEGERRAVVEIALSSLHAWTGGEDEALILSGEPSGEEARGERLELYGAREVADSFFTPPARGVALEYILGERAGYVLVVLPSGKLHMRKIAGSRELVPLWERFKKTLMAPRLDGEDARTHQALAERLYVELISPVEDLIVDHEHLYLAPDDRLHELPFEALARPTESEARAHYLFMDYDTSYLPSLSIGSMIQRRHARTRRDGDRPEVGDVPTAVLLGAPTLHQSSRQLIELTRDLPGDGVASMSSLFGEIPESKKEIEAIARQLSSRGFAVERATGEQATEGFLSRSARPEQVTILHVATHGLSDAQSWNQELELAIGMAQPVLLLASEQPGAQGVASPHEDGLLRLDEVLGLSSQAELVVLSGCTTGRGWRALGEGAYGFAGAFLRGGSAQVVASSWSVDDEVARALMTSFYDHLSSDLDAARAFNRARRQWYEDEARALAHHGEVERAPSPFFWASFRVIGVPGDALSVR